jgi:hypothetical protein
VTSTDNLTWTATSSGTLNVPIFLNGDINNVIVLPISNATLHTFTVSPDGQCIGKFNPGALAADCSDSPDNCEKWETAGSLGGFITLEQADSVIVVDAGESLCVLVTGTAGTPGTDNFKHCARTDGKITATGDYCSTTTSPGGCADSYWMAATFAASAVKINDGTGTPECNGGHTATDGGTDAAPTGDDGGDDGGAGDAAPE